VVTLSGQVDSPAQKQRAQAIAKQAKGVKKVINQLTLKPKIP
jgi:osmotically-inducible protein OsmY